MDRKSKTLGSLWEHFGSAWTEDRTKYFVVGTSKFQSGSTCQRPCRTLLSGPPHSSLGRAVYTQLAWDFRNRVRTMRFTPRGQQGVCLLVHLVYWPIRILDRLRECAIYPSLPPGRPVGRHRIPCFPTHPSAYFLLRLSLVLVHLLLLLLLLFEPLPTANLVQVTRGPAVPCLLTSIVPHDCK